MAGIYIHIPFCKKKCNYCDFYKTLDTGLSDKYIDALIKEIDIRKDYLSSDENVETIYFGGGTPSVLSINQVRKILDHLSKSFTINKDAEITLELNPDDAEKAFLKALKREGVNRLSIGIQSWNDDILSVLNRRHNSQQAQQAIDIAREEGFSNISIDLIYGIPGSKATDWEKDLDKAFKQGLEHISAYHLTIEENTMFGKMKKLGEMEEVDEELSEKQFSKLTELARKYGYLHYEISNLCKEGYFSRHNTNYWKRVNYIGLGPSAHSYNGYSRQWNVSDVASYVESLNKGVDFFEKETLDEKEKYNEYVMTAMRTMWGVDMSYLEAAFNKETHDFLLNLATRFIKYGMIERAENNNLVLTEQGKMISDNIISELMMT